MSVYFALLMWLTGGKSIYDLPDWWSTRIVLWQTETADGDLVRITLPILVAAAALLTWLLMTRSSAGRQLYAMGGNPEAARRLGIDIAGMHFLAYGYLGLMAGLAGLLQAHRVGEAVPNAMDGNELNVLAAAVLGGASLVGGIGTVGGVLLGILLLAMLQNGLNLLGVSLLLLPDRDRPRDPGLDLDHRPVQPGRGGATAGWRAGMSVTAPRPHAPSC